MRKGSIKRNSKETQIQVALTIEGRGRYQVSTGIRFFDHMLELFAHHGGFDLKLKARGDLDVDQHHTVEDVGIVLGQAFDKALGSKRGILRAGYFLMPMDETMGMAAVDFCGRTAAVVDTKVRTRLVGDLQSELVDDFFEGFARGARANVHARVLYGRSSHHKIEALFKAFARALRAACWRDQTDDATSAQQPRECCDDRDRRLRRGKSGLSEEGVGLAGAGVRHYGRSSSRSRSATKVVLPGVGHFASTAVFGTDPVCKMPLRMPLTAEFRFWASALGCSGCSRAARNRLKRHGLGLFARGMRALLTAREVAACGMESTRG